MYDAKNYEELEMMRGLDTQNLLLVAGVTNWQAKFMQVYDIIAIPMLTTMIGIT